MKEGFYEDGVTRITDSFYTCICPDGHKHWEITYRKVCSDCGKKLVLCMPSDRYAQQIKKEAVS
ncbi:MAG: hypothetical protein K2J60_03600 [Acetatifactor sp.]|nr:hypothetical protein [Acetatifactor sp.]